MKKLFLILLVILLCSSKCKEKLDDYPSVNVYEQTYGINQEKESINDLFTLLHNYSQDSIPLSKWPAFMGTNQDGFILQQMLTKRSDSINYIFIYNIHKKVDTTFYEVKVRKIITVK